MSPSRRYRPHQLSFCNIQLESVSGHPAVCLSRTAYIGPKSRTERRRKTKIGTEVATSHMTRTPLSRSKGQRSRSRGRFAQRGLNEYGSCSGQPGNVFGVGKYCYVASARRRATGEERGGGYCVATRTACYLETIHELLFLENSYHSVYRAIFLIFDPDYPFIH